MENFGYKIVLLAILMSVAGGARGASLLDCADIESVEARLACYDELAGRVEEKISESQAPAVSTQKREVIRQEAAAVAIGQKPVTDAFTIKRAIRSKIMRMTYIGDDGRRFVDQTTHQVAFRAGDRVRLERGFMGAKILVRSDGLRLKVKEVTP